MIVTYREISRIKFPVYSLPSNNWHRTDGLLYIDGVIVDDKNQPGATMGIRRLQSPHSNLLPINRMIKTHLGILKQSTKTFIDSNGTPFMYEKTKMCALKYLEILKVDRREAACLIWLKGIKQPFTVPRPPAHGMLWAGLLHLHGLPWMLYEYSEEQKKDTRRKV